MWPNNPTAPDYGESKHQAFALWANTHAKPFQRFRTLPYIYHLNQWWWCHIQMLRGLWTGGSEFWIVTGIAVCLFKARDMDERQTWFGLKMLDISVLLWHITQKVWALQPSSASAKTSQESCVYNKPLYKCIYPSGCHNSVNTGNIRIVLFKGRVGILFDPAAAMTAFQP